MHLVLASASPRRRELLARLGLPFVVETADVDEAPRPAESPDDYVRRLAVEKAHGVAAASVDGAVVVGADTTVVLAGAILGKPATPSEARAMLGDLRGREHTVATGVAVVAGGGTLAEVRETRVTMRAYSPAEVEHYIASGDPFDKAGGYAIQHRAFAPVAAIAGCYLNVVGLPLCRLRELLGRAGVPVPAAGDAFAAENGAVCAHCRSVERVGAG